MARPYRLTPKRAAALKKAQAASAKKRKGTGRRKPVAKGRYRRVQANATATKKRVVKRVNRATNTPAKRRKIYRRAAIATASVAAVGGAAYTYRNRERLIVTPMAQRRFVKIAEREKGRRLTKRERIAVKNREKSQHSTRSTDAARAYKDARDFARKAYKSGYSISPHSKNYIFAGKTLAHIDDGKKRNGKYGTDSGTFMHELYRKDVNARAEHRLNRMRGKKQAFGYKSGKQKKVVGKGKVVKQWW